MSSYSARLLDIVLSASEDGVLSVGERQLAQALFDWRVDEYGFADLASTAVERVSSKLIENKRVLMKVAPKFGFGTGQSDQQEASEPETKPDPESGAETEHTSESIADAEPEAETESTPEANFDESTEESPDIEPDSTSDTETETEPETNLEALPAEEPVDYEVTALCQLQNIL